MSSLQENENASVLCTSKKQKCKVIVFGGPTASGKSGLALRLAERVNGVIINADSMQVYKNVPTLTARPSEKETQKVEHILYGFLGCNEKFSTFSWACSAAEKIRSVVASKRVPILVGGTGMYLQTLENGMSPVPEVCEKTRAAVRSRFEALGYEAFRAEFIKKDPQIRLTDPQRLIRAAEVFEETGKSIVYWQSLEFTKFIDADFFNILVLPPREILYERCDKRFGKMMENGAEREVAALLAQNPASDSLIMKAIGVREIGAFLNKETTLEAAVDKARQATRNYAKRQTTWFKHRFKANITISDGNFDTILTNVLHFLS